MPQWVAGPGWAAAEDQAVSAPSDAPVATATSESLPTPAPTLAGIMAASMRAVQASGVGAVHRRYQRVGTRVIQASMVFLVLLNLTRWASFSWFWILAPMLIPMVAAAGACLTVAVWAAVSPAFRRRLRRGATPPALEGPAEW